MKQKQVRSLFITLLVVSLLSLSPLAWNRAQAKQDRKPEITAHTHGSGPDSDDDGEPGSAFIIYAEGGGIACRHANAREAALLRAGRKGVALRPISRGREGLTAQGGLKIMLRSTPQLDGFPEAKAAFLRAAATWESIIQADGTIIIDVDFGPTRFGEPYSPGTLGSTDVQLVGANNIYPDVRAQLLATASSPQETALYQALPPTTLGTDLGDTTGVSAPTAPLRALGILDPVADPDGELSQLGPPPSIGFNSNFTFDFDPSDGIDADKTDFDAVATHEIGHALGFVTGVGSRELSPTSATRARIWDFFRFRPGVTIAGLTTTPRIQLSGGEQVFFVGGNEYGLSTGRANGTGGDQRQGSHWKEDEGTAGTGQYVGIMDPTLAAGTRKALTAADLIAIDTFGYRVRPETIITEELSIDDNGKTQGSFFQRTGAIVVNRLTPARYPATLQAIRIRIPVPSNEPSPVGSAIRLVAFTDPGRTGQPPASPQLIFDQTVTLPTLPNSRIFEFRLPTPPVITAGDLYVGFQSPDGKIQVFADGSAPRQRSFISVDNGASFQALQADVGGSMVPVNFRGRAVISGAFGTNSAPALTSVSPSAVAPGGTAFTLYVNGTNFLPGSVVRWNGSDRPTTVVSGALVQAQISAADIASAGTAAVTVTSPEPGGGPSNQLNVSISADNPVPTLTRLTPNQGAIGGAQFTLTVLGTNFLPNSVLRWDGADRPTTFVNSTQVTAQIPATDLAALATPNVTVFNPGPGGGASNPLPFGVIACDFSLSAANQSFFSARSQAGVAVNTASPCAWTAQSEAPWITLTGATSGIGIGVVTYALEPNTDPKPRTGVVRVGGQAVTLRQYGLLNAVSAANFAPAIAPDSIASVFGVDLATSTVAASTVPLPTQLAGTSMRVIDSQGVTRVPSLFFVSPGQINFLVPAGTAPGSAIIAVAVDGLTVASGQVQVTATAPAVFTANQNGSGAPAAIVLRVAAGNVQTTEPVFALDSAQNRYVARPISLGPETDKVSLVLFGTGVRQRTSLDAVQVDVGGVNLPAQFAGAQPDFAGLDQLNVELPRSLIGRGEVTVTVTVNGRTANPVTIAIQ